MPPGVLRPHGGPGGPPLVLPGGPATEPKLANLRRMRRAALALLLAMVALLATSASLRGNHPWLAWLQAFAEAAAVGGIADWFAVVALFRHPLGLPIPHTAIIPRNKEAIGDNLGAFVEHNFLTPQIVMQRLGERSLARAGAEWLVQPANAEAVARRMCRCIPPLIHRLGDRQLQRALHRAIAPQLRRLDLASVASQVLDLLTRDGAHQALLDRGLKALDGWLVANRSLIGAKVSEASKYTPPFVDSYVANRFIDGLLALLREVAGNPGHEVRARFDAAAQELIDALRRSAAHRERAEAIKQAVLRHLRQESLYRRIVDDLKARLLTDLSSGRSRLQTQLAQGVAALADAVLDDPALQRRLDEWALQALQELVVRHRHQVSLLISSVVRSWDADEVSTRIEAEIGKDLQYIRINGTLVGGTIGLVLHAAVQLVA